MNSPITAHLPVLTPTLKLYSYKTAAEVLDCSPSKVQKLVLAGQIPIVKVGSETRITEEDLRAWIQRGRHYHQPKECSEDSHADALPVKEDTIAGS